MRCVCECECVFSCVGAMMLTPLVRARAGPPGSDRQPGQHQVTACPHSTGSTRIGNACRLSMQAYLRGLCSVPDAVLTADGTLPMRAPARATWQHALGGDRQIPFCNTTAMFDHTGTARHHTVI